MIYLSNFLNFPPKYSFFIVGFKTDIKNEKKSMKFSKISTKFSKDLAKINKISHQTCRFASKITKGKVKSAPNHKDHLNIHELFVQKIDLNIHQIYSINQGSLSCTVASQSL